MATPAHLLPPDEAGRLHALRQFDVVAALREPIFQGLVGLVARIFQLPIVFITTVGGEQVDFLATHGVPGLEVLPREQALCSLAIGQQHTVTLNHMLTAPTNLHQQTAQKLGLQAYAGAPIVLEQNYAVGVFCVSSTVPREFSPDEVAVLEDLAGLVSHLVVVRQHLLTQEAAPQWEALQQQAKDRLHELNGLLSYLSQRQLLLVPTSAALLQAVRQRLQKVCALLQDAV